MPDSVLSAYHENVTFIHDPPDFACKSRPKALEKQNIFQKNHETDQNVGNSGKENTKTMTFGRPMLHYSSSTICGGNHFGNPADAPTVP